MAGRHEHARGGADALSREALRPSGQGEEELLHLRDVHLLALRVGQALTQAGGDDGEPSPVEGLGDRGELGDDVLAVEASIIFVRCRPRARLRRRMTDCISVREVELHGILLGSSGVTEAINEAIDR